MNKEAIKLLIQNNARLRRHQAKLESMQPGTYCVHRNWGLGQIQSFDERTQRLIVDFEAEDSPKGQAMDPVFCIDKLEILADDDVLVRHRQATNDIDDMIKKRPADLVADILSRAENHSATALEIETILSRLMGPAKFKKWWTQTKKVLVKDPRIGVPSKKTEPFVLRDEPIKAEDEILEEFFETKAPKKKINFAAKLVEMSVEHKDIQSSLPRILEELTASLAETRQLNPGERLHGIWIRNDLARHIHSDVETLEPTSASIILASNDLSTLATQIPAAFYKRYIDLIERTLPDQWERATFDLLKNSSGKLTAESINYLVEKERKAQLAQTLERWLVEQNLRAPVLIWVLKNRNSKKYADIVKGLMTPRLLSAIFFAIDYEALQNNSTRRIPLAEMVSEDQDLINDLLADSNYETAHDLAQTLMLNQGFEDLSKKSLLARFIRLFPSIQSIVAGETPSAAESSAASDELIVSKESYDARKKEYEVLIGEKIPRNKEDIAEARAHGDLRENAEYKMARQEQDILLARRNELEIEIHKARVTDFSDAPTDIVGIGSKVSLFQASTNQTVEYSILGAWDSKPEAHILSYQTPLARALMGRSTGESIDLEIDGHEEKWTIKAISRWIDG